MIYLYSLIVYFGLLSCSDPADTMAPASDQSMNPSTDTTTIDTTMATDTFNLDQATQAAVTAVSFTGSENSYTFQVELTSPDTGCDQYADWWEVLDEEGNLIYRRVLLHSHVTEQPFTRSGGPVQIGADTFVYIRGHMNNLGYGSLVFAGTISDGFEAIEVPSNFATNLAEVEPLPDGCAF